MPDFMPLGTIVTLKEGTKKVMITGRIVRNTETGRIYDYCAVLWPEGQISSGDVFMFDHTDIGCLYYIGMQDTEEFQFRFRLEEQYEQL